MIEMPAPGAQAASRPDCLQALVGSNVHLLVQAMSLAERIDDDLYRRRAGPAGHRVGAHMRHIIEFYECFFDGLESNHVDYDARKRDESLENNPRAAAGKIRSIIQRLERDPALRSKAVIWVRMEDAEADAVSDPYLASSPGRELQVLRSHTIHHFALIAVALEAQGVPVEPDFGVAPSTLRYQASRRQKRSAVEAA